MEKTTKRNAIIISCLVFVILVGTLYLAYKNITLEKDLTMLTEEEKQELIPAMPGMSLSSEDRGKCYYQVEYIYDISKEIDLTSELKDIFQANFQQLNWSLAGERQKNGYEVLEFRTEKTGQLEVSVIKFKYNPEIGSVFSFGHKWSDCLGMDL